MTVPVPAAPSTLLQWDDIPDFDFSTNALRRLPNGLDRSGAQYTVFNHPATGRLTMAGWGAEQGRGQRPPPPPWALSACRNTHINAPSPACTPPPPPAHPGYRMYRHTPPAAAGAQQQGSPGGGSTGEAAAVKQEVKEEVKEEPADGQQQAQQAVQQAVQQEEGGSDSGDESDAAGTKPSREARLRAYTVPPDPQAQCGAWELVATTLQEFEVRWGCVGGWVRQGRQPGGLSSVHAFTVPGALPC